VSQSTATSLDVAQNDGPYSSAAELRAVHGALLRRERLERASEAFRAEVLTFIRRGCETGKFIDDDNERRACQGMLDYWTTVLYRSADDEIIDSTLAPFDPTLAPELPEEPRPYVGLKAFDEQNHERFFGRRDRINDLVHLIRKERFLAVVGPSGSGKSSLVLSGLLPALRAGAVLGSQNWYYFPPLVPSSAPLVSLARAVRPAAANIIDWETRLTQGMLADPLYLAKVVGALTRQPALITIDQFEEVFTLGARQPVMDAFAANILGLVRSSGPRHTVVVTMRSDFELKMSLLPGLKSLFERTQVRVTPMGAPELREAIEEPARQVGLKIEPRVVDALINDILGYDAALPLLQFTLLRLWELRDHNRVTWEIYQATGGGKEALERSAEAFYKDLSPELQRTMQRILLRMVRPRAGLEFTSKRIRRAQLYQGGEAAYRIDEVVGRMLSARLLRQTDAGTPDEQLEVAHEALVRNWRRLVDWLEEERERLRSQQRLLTAAESWKNLGEDPTALLRGALLDEALRLPSDELGDPEREFLRASLRARFADEAAQRAAEQAKEEARQREVAQARALAAAEQLRAVQAQALAETERERAAEQQRRSEAETERAAEAERRSEAERLRAAEKERSARRLRRAALALAAVLAVAVIAGIYAYFNYLEAERQREVAVAAQANSRADAEKAGTAQAQEQLARQTAESLAGARGTAQAVAVIAGTTAIAAQETALADANLRSTAVVSVSNVLRVVDTKNNELGTQVAIRSTAEVQARNAAEQAAIVRDQFQQQALAVGTAQADAQNARQTADTLRIAAETKRDQTNAFSLRDKALYESNRAHRLQLMMAALSLSADPALVEDFHTALQLNHLPVRTDTRRVRMAWRPDGNRIVIASGTKIELWNAPQGAAGLRDKQALREQESVVTSIAWSPDGARFAAGNADGTISLWDATNGQATTTLSGHSREVTGLAWRSDSKQLLSSSVDGTLRIWNFADGSAEVIVGKLGERLTWAAWSPDATQFVTSAGKTLYIRDGVTGAISKIIDGHTDIINTSAWSFGGQRILSASDDGTARIWDVASGVASQIFQVGSQVNSAYWSPDGQRIATASVDATVRIWFSGNPSAQPMTLPTGENTSLSAAFWNPDGWRLAVASTDGTVREFWPQNSAISTEQMLSLGEQLLAAQAVPTLAPNEIDAVLQNAPTPVPAATITLTPSPTSLPTLTPTRTPTSIPTSMPIPTIR
jgi:energy-coupling factor transporter ATP-binding protein EcfA2/molybdopterin-guanine dinucleotide biosynthesis protein